MKEENIFPVALLTHEVDTSDFSENEIRTIAIMVNIKEWDKKIPVIPARDYDLGIDKQKNWYRYKEAEWIYIKELSEIKSL